MTPSDCKSLLDTAIEVMNRHLPNVERMEETWFRGFSGLFKEDKPTYIESVSFSSLTKNKDSQQVKVIFYQDSILAASNIAIYPFQIEGASCTKPEDTRPIDLAQHIFNIGNIAYYLPKLTEAGDVTYTNKNDILVKHEIGSISHITYKLDGLKACVLDKDRRPFRDFSIVDKPKSRIIRDCLYTTNISADRSFLAIEHYFKPLGVVCIPKSTATDVGKCHLVLDDVELVLQFNSSNFRVNHVSDLTSAEYLAYGKIYIHLAGLDIPKALKDFNSYKEKRIEDQEPHEAPLTDGVSIT